VSRADDNQLYQDLQGNPELYRKLRQRSLDDLYFFSKYVLRYKDMTPSCHKPMCDFISIPSWKRKLTLQPRAHLKSSIFTIAHSLWSVTREPHRSFLLMHEAESKAVEFLYNIRMIIKDNPIYNALFPEYIPDWSDKGHRWSTTIADIRRPKDCFYYGPSFSAVGVKGAVTGGHYTNIKLDDMYAKQAANSPAESEQRWVTYQETDSLLVSAKDDFIDMIGTHWNTYDTYVRAMEEEGGFFLSPDGTRALGMNLPNPSLLVWRRSCYKTDGKTPIWPERFDEPELERLRRKWGAAFFALQYLNNPIAPSNVDFNLLDLRYWDHDPHNPNAVRLYEPMSGKWSDPIFPEDVHCIQVLDPAVGLKEHHSYTAISVLWGLPGGGVLVRDTFRKRVKKATPEKDGWLDQLYHNQARYDPSTTFFESVGFQKTIGQEDIKARNVRESHPLSYQEITLGYRAQSKEVRIRSVIQPVLADHQLFIHKNHQDLIEELRVHPIGHIRDLLDTLAHGIPKLSKPLSHEEQEDWDRYMRREKMNLGTTTGYGWDY
jgi:hypothetical protein